MIRQEFRSQGVLAEEAKISGIAIFKTPEGKLVLADSKEPIKTFAGIYEVQQQEGSTPKGSNISYVFSGEVRVRSSVALKDGAYVKYDTQGRMIEATDKTQAIGKTLEASRLDNTLKINLWGE